MYKFPLKIYVDQHTFGMNVQASDRELQSEHLSIGTYQLEVILLISNERTM